MSFMHATAARQHSDQFQLWDPGIPSSVIRWNTQQPAWYLLVSNFCSVIRSFAIIYIALQYPKVWCSCISLYACLHFAYAVNAFVHSTIDKTSLHVTLVSELYGSFRCIWGIPGSYTKGCLVGKGGISSARDRAVTVNGDLVGKWRSVVGNSRFCILSLPELVVTL